MDGLSWATTIGAGEKGMEGAHQGAREGYLGRDLVPTSSFLSAAVPHKWWACMGGGGARTLIGSLLPPLYLYIGLWTIKGVVSEFAVF